MIQGLFGRLAPAGAGVVKSFYFTKAVECPLGTRVLNLNPSLRLSSLVNFYVFNLGFRGSKV